MSYSTTFTPPLGSDTPPPPPHPNVVGTHWHQFSDQPLTGRFDGENFNVGFTDVCDEPYPEMRAVLRAVGNAVYRLRAGCFSEWHEN